ncbi:bifunctional adenosylcobinamide kinase/adenosylcobinamide-phosphate guanylyltransferase [Azospirillum brasilense]|uniref:bifunctional adenosylcobinamide kinase/adenosylcobinamide-phosphate guanylyltransferase n=1 Tax=Azospirillum brasilense TaxID=192 RepID=UPI000E6A1229|nr:bifunctional adenosylcobinamide kinase/adenosylcobinamide-phosphate guanylyltransferase [Azospirillum brasilense]NUB31879.1 bifunctional adenosylcobinamide kinase/adenosylcobinamide-phosphate guanylyltransferase [Azospirillum brasilense]RIV99750.1 bifunctional adenosylcobinamide kinase/adenosylcobinamide-phosphate guanylyltransferase [Azospirillum brasilense]
MSTDITLVLGGARSGKSRYAEGLVTASPGPRVYIATAQVWDSEMADRVARHKQDRGPGWTTVEEPLDLPGALRRHAGSGANVLVDCLTLWLSNLMMADADVPARSTELLAALAGVEGRVVLVSNEVGLGIVPDNALARRFRDHAGRLHQDIAAVAQRVAFVAAGLPLLLKGEKP